jgi:hypothetical protein
LSDIALLYLIILPSAISLVHCATKNRQYSSDDEDDNVVANYAPPPTMSLYTPLYILLLSPLLLLVYLLLNQQIKSRFLQKRITKTSQIRGLKVCPTARNRLPGGVERVWDRVTSGFGGYILSCVGFIACVEME